MPGKPKENADLSQQQEIALLKDRFIEYYSDLPIKQAAADHIHRDLSTVLKWEKADPDFASRVLEAKAAYARTHGKKRPDNLLPKLYPELKPEKQEVELTLPTTVTINHVHPGNHDQANPEAG